MRWAHLRSRAGWRRCCAGGAVQLELDAVTGSEGCGPPRRSAACEAGIEAAGAASPWGAGPPAREGGAGPGTQAQAGRVDAGDLKARGGSDGDDGAGPSARGRGRRRKAAQERAEEADIQVTCEAMGVSRARLTGPGSPRGHADRGPGRGGPCRRPNARPCWVPAIRNGSRTEPRRRSRPP